MAPETDPSTEPRTPLNRERVMRAAVAFADRMPWVWGIVGWLVLTFVLDRRRFLVRLRLFINGWRRRPGRQPAAPPGFPHRRSR